MQPRVIEKLSSSKNSMFFPTQEVFYWLVKLEKGMRERVRQAMEREEER